jgi:hypothetical protein
MANETCAISEIVAATQKNFPSRDHLIRGQTKKRTEAPTVSPMEKAFFLKLANILNAKNRCCCAAKRFRNNSVIFPSDETMHVSLVVFPCKNSLASCRGMFCRFGILQTFPSTSHRAHIEMSRFARPYRSVRIGLRVIGYNNSTKEKL